MRPTENFRRQHTELAAILSQLAAWLEPKVLQSDASEVRRLLISFAAKLKIHHSLEDDYLYPRLVECPDQTMSTIARRCQQELCGTSKKCMEYTERWKSPGKIEASPIEFITQTRQVISDLRTRISREDNDLYEAFDRLTPQQALNVLTHT